MSWKVQRRLDAWHGETATNRELGEMCLVDEMRVIEYVLYESKWLCFILTISGRTVGYISDVGQLQQSKAYLMDLCSLGIAATTIWSTACAKTIACVDTELHRTWLRLNEAMPLKLVPENAHRRCLC